MGMLELIQQKAFLGKEFLTWLWHRAERHGRVDCPGGDPVEIEIQGPIMLDAQYGDARASTLKGESPASSAEAATALLEGKKLKRAKLKISRRDAEWVFTLDGENFNVSGLSVPKPGRLPFEDAMMLRLEWVGECEQVLEQLCHAFRARRLDAAAWPDEVRDLQAWVRRKQHATSEALQPE